uniref:Uncharacterized protein n=1 Tax=Ditylenchus dipsaci TaxID=166011 RepID=A0A915ENS2_9BILA
MAGMLRYLQWNSILHTAIQLIEHQLKTLWEKIPTLGLKTSKLLDAIYDNARSEEEIMEYLQDADYCVFLPFAQVLARHQSRAHPTSHLD